jgi:asparagine synthase (glutamine-hydrolysing)
MCGIIGNISSGDSDSLWLEKGLSMISHRGPDDSGIWRSEHGLVALGHTRLSVIDLSSLGSQPMHLVDKGITIVFNGEIYNYLELRTHLKSKGYQFKTNSDTEVIMTSFLEWGLDFLSKLNGMFSFCLYDSNNEIALLARDRAGEKPLFFSINGSSFSFCSELKGLLVNPSFERKIDVNSLDSFLFQGFVAGEHCIFEKVKKLPPASYLLFDIKTGNYFVKEYWTFLKNRNLNSFIYTDESALIEELDYLLNDSIEKQLVADVPVGVLLSGGIDSSLITAYASKHVNTLKTFTVTFPKYAKFDESSHARLISNQFGTNHIELEATEITPEVLFKLAEQFDEPIVDSSMIPTYLVTKLVKEHCTVALGGDGGDELFGGYGHHSRLLWVQEKFGKIPLVVRKLISNCSGRHLPTGFKGRNWLQALGTNFDSELPLLSTLFESQQRKLLMSKFPEWNTVAEYIRNAELPKGTLGLLDRVTSMDFKYYLPEDILVKIDRSSMLNSLELRAPLLDYRIIEFAFGKVPISLKANSSERKIILKRIAEKVLPREFEKNRKQGFSVPIGQWMRKGDWNSFVYDNLVNSPNPFFDTNFVKSLFKSHINGFDHTERLFGLLMFQLWIDKYKAYI